MSNFDGHVLVGSRNKPIVPGLFVGAAIVFWTANDDKPRPGLILNIGTKEQVAKDKLGKTYIWDGALPKIDVMSVSPFDTENGEPVLVNGLSHVDDVMTMLAKEGKPEMLIAICPRYALVKNLEVLG